MDNLHSRHLNALNSQQQQQQQQYLNQYQYTGMHAMHLQSNHHHSQPLTQSQTVIGSGISSSNRLTTGLAVGDTIGAAASISSSSILNSVTPTTTMRRDTEIERLRLRLMLLEQQMQNQQSSSAAQQLTSVSASSLSSVSPSSQYVPNGAGASGVDEYIASLMRNQLNSSLKSSEERLNKLDALLNQREYEIKEMKTKFAIETQRLENEINQLKSAVNRREEELLSEKMRYASLHKEHDAVKTKLSDTNKYLSELATKEETRQLKNELREAQEEIERQKDELKNSEGKITKAKMTVRDKNHEIKDVKEELEREKLAKEKIRIEFDSYKQKTNLTGEIVEKLEQNASLCAELESAKKLLSGLQERNLNQQAKYEKQLGETKELLKQQTDANVSLKSQLARKEASIKELETSLKTIEIENEELKNDNLVLKEKVKSLEALLGNDSIKALRVLFKEINECASELESLVQTCSDINEGKEIDCCRFLGSANRKSNDHIDLVNNCDTLLSMVNSENLLKRISEIRELRKKLKELKTMISDRVAENIGANVSCMTQ